MSCKCYERRVRTKRALHKKHKEWTERKTLHKRCQCKRMSFYGPLGMQQAGQGDDARTHDGDDYKAPGQNVVRSERQPRAKPTANMTQEAMNRAGIACATYRRRTRIECVMRDLIDLAAAIDVASQSKWPVCAMDTGEILSTLEQEEKHKGCTLR